MYKCTHRIRLELMKKNHKVQLAYHLKKILLEYLSQAVIAYTGVI